jgi:hypothetical protein
VLRTAGTPHTDKLRSIISYRLTALPPAYLSRNVPSLQHPIIRSNVPRMPPGGHKISWRERLQALRHLPKLLRMVWEANPAYVVGILLLPVIVCCQPG